MRKIALIFAAFAAISMFGIIGCGDNDNTPTNPTTAKLPTWDKAGPCSWPYDIYELVITEQPFDGSNWSYILSFYMRHDSGFAYGINTPIWCDPQDSVSYGGHTLGSAYSYLQGLGYDPQFFYNPTIGPIAPNVFECSHIIWQQATFGRYKNLPIANNDLVHIKFLTPHKLVDPYSTFKWACTDEGLPPEVNPRRVHNRNCANGYLPFKLMVNGQLFDYGYCDYIFPPTPGYWCQYDEYPTCNPPLPPHFEEGWN